MNKLDIKAGDRYGKLSIIREVEPDHANTRNVRRKFYRQGILNTLEKIKGK